MTTKSWDTIEPRELIDIPGPHIAPRARRTEPAPAELALDAYERIELAAAAWRNAYRALDRRDAPAVERYLREAIDHGIALVRGLYG